MKIFQLFFLLTFSIFSSFVMSYIALATMIGPWMGPTLILFGLILTSLIKNITPHDMLLPVIGGAIGGIVATGVSSAFSTYYFIDKDAFMAWAHTPVLMISSIAALAICAGLFALWIVDHIKNPLLHEQKLSFPIGKLVYDVALSSDNAQSKKQLIVGVLGTLFYSFSNTLLRLKTIWYKGSIQFFNAHHIGIFSFPALRFDMELFPMFIAIGFIAGHLMTVPLLIGTLARIAVVDVVHSTWFGALADADFMLAFCSGIVLVGALLSLVETPKRMWKFLTTTQHGSASTFSFKNFFSVFTFSILVILILLFSYFNFSYASQCYAILFTALCTYQLVVIAGKVGMAFLGRFATFIMVPGIFLFSFTPLQATIIATFVELCGGVATELLFGLKTAELAQLEAKQVRRFQIAGIVIGAVAVAVAFWFLVTHFQLGSEQLFAQRAQGRALLIQAGDFDLYALLAGAVFGLVLHFLKINSMLVLGGLLMSLSMIVPLVVGGVISLLIHKKERFEPLCSGVYATISVWMIITALIGR